MAMEAEIVVNPNSGLDTAQSAVDPASDPSYALAGDSLHSPANQALLKEAQLPERPETEVFLPTENGTIAIDGTEYSISGFNKALLTNKTLGEIGIQLYPATGENGQSLKGVANFSYLPIVNEQTGEIVSSKETVESRGGYDLQIPVELTPLKNDDTDSIAA